jgi:hypothetical protein
MGRAAANQPTSSSAIRVTKIGTSGAAAGLLDLVERVGVQYGEQAGARLTRAIADVEHQRQPRDVCNHLDYVQNLGHRGLHLGVGCATKQSEMSSVSQFGRRPGRRDHFRHPAWAASSPSPSLLCLCRSASLSLSLSLSLALARARSRALSLSSPYSPQTQPWPPVAKALRIASARASSRRRAARRARPATHP